MKKLFRKLFGVLVFLFLFTIPSGAQSLLKNTVTIHAKRQALHDVLTIISNESNVTFSYNTKVINRDSLISLDAVNKPLGEVLRMIFHSGFEFKESGSYIIIRRKPVSTSKIVSQSASGSDYYYITGKVVEEESGEALADVTVYEKQQLISSLTDRQGMFSMKLKNKFPEAMLSVSRVGFMDTSVRLAAKFNQNVTIALERELPVVAAMDAKEAKPDLDESEQALVIAVDKGEPVEKKWISKLFISSKQKIQSLNLHRFYTTRAYQFSFWPGIGTHGRMNAQVINGVSVNLIGGYSGGTSLFEIGGLFNIDKRDVKNGQVGGLFNVVGGQLQGVQVASLYNEVADTVQGTQISGLMNNARGHVKGVQISSLLNKAKSIEGLQVGFINITEGSGGSSFGFINISKRENNKRRVGFILRLPRKV